MFQLSDVSSWMGKFIDSKKLASNLCLTTTGVAVFVIFTTYNRASAAIISIDPVNLVKLFEDEGFQKPQVTFNETETSFNLSIIGKPVDSTATLDFDFQNDFWRGKLTFAQTDPFINPDSITVSGNIFHQAGINRPHPSDELKGDIYTFGETINSSGSTTSGKVTISFGDTVNHSKNHFDSYKGKLTGTVRVDTFKNIDAWTFELKGVHSVPEPLTILGSATALGFGALLKREYSGKQKKS